MRNKRSHILWLILAATLATLLSLSIGLEGVGSQTSALSSYADSPSSPAADLILIDILHIYGPLDKPPVPFEHERHLQALERSKKLEWDKDGCFTCHEKNQDDELIIKFKRTEDISKAADRDNYHKNCIDCHTQMRAEKLTTGPLDADCRTCHVVGGPAKLPKRPAPVIDRQIHYRHSTAYEDDPQKCGNCHHLYDEKLGKTIPIVDSRQVNGSCSYCHFDEPLINKEGKLPERTRSLREASHELCVNCHLKIARQNVKNGTNTFAGPFVCSGCHSSMAMKAYQKRNAQIPAEADLRIKTSQEDLFFVKIGQSSLAQNIAAPKQNLDRMGQVPFDHKLHEEKTTTCVECHHKSLESCSKSCHTLEGTRESQGINLATAMHERKSDRSCTGCHAKKTQEEKTCASCHSSREKVLSQDVNFCWTCHMQKDSTSTSNSKKSETAQLSPKELSRISLEASLKAKKKSQSTYSLEDIPEIVTISRLSNEYEPSVMPHRKIVLHLLEAIKNNEIASAFHLDEGTLCRACHHNSPPSKKPPSCVGCHTIADGKFDREYTVQSSSNRLQTPDLKSAYHRQCMGCHFRLGIEGKSLEGEEDSSKIVPLNTDCTGCHKLKDSS